MHFIIFTQSRVSGVAKNRFQTFVDNVLVHDVASMLKMFIWVLHNDPRVDAKLKYTLPISSVYNIFRHPVHVKLWVKILYRTELYAKTYNTSYIPKCGNARCNQSGGITILKGGPFPNNLKDSTFWYPKVSKYTY